MTHPRPIPDALVEHVKAEEALRLQAYRPLPHDVWTIGWGHTEGVAPGDTCTEEQARIWLKNDMDVARRRLYTVLTHAAIEGLTDNQWAALLSFAYNAGAAPGWTIWKVLNEGNLAAVPDQLRRFRYSGGRVVQGLVNRREREIALWRKS